ncbi:MAG: hypothetical protein WC454_10205, partial [Phycisphaerae bacterium]
GTCVGCVFNPATLEKLSLLQIQVDARNVGPGQTAKITEVPMSPAVDEVEKLRQRVAAGVEKLVTAWQKMKTMTDEDFANAQIQFWEADKKLKGLCAQLEFMGYHDCLWTKEPYPKEWGTRRGCSAWPGEGYCFVCSMDPHRFWDEKIAYVPSRKVNHHEDQGEQVIEFLKTLGGVI